MAEWLGAVPALLWAVALSVGPGAPIALALRVRGYLLLPVAIAASFAVSGVASIAAPVAGLRWSPALPFGLGLLLGILLLIGWKPFRHADRWSVRHHLREWTVPLLSLLLAAAVLFTTLRHGLGSPDAISHGADAVFHLNAVQFIIDTGNASQFDMTMASERILFYPTLWHGVVANVAMLSGAEIPVAMNTLTAVVHALVWPAAALALARTLFGAGANITLGAGVAAAAFSAFPMQNAPWGALFPNLLATALLPIIIAFGVQALGLAADRRDGLPPVRAWTVAIGALGAACLAQPSAFFTAVIILIPGICVALVRARRRSLRALVGGLVATAALIAVFAAVWSLSTTNDHHTVYERGGVVGALVDGLTNAPFLDAYAWGVTLFIAIGIWVSWRLRANRWWTVSYLLLLGMYVTAAGLPDIPFRTALTGVWYNDGFRLAGLLPVGALPFAALGIARLLGLVQRGIISSCDRRGLRRAGLIGGTLVVTLLASAATQSVSVARAVDAVRWVHDDEGPDAAVDTDERALMEMIPDLVPEGSVIAANPANGSAFAYALTGRKVLFPHFRGNDAPEAWELAEHLKDGGAEVCAAAQHLGVDYVLDFGSQFIPERESRTREYPGLTDVSGSPILTEIAAVGEARLFEITGCG